MKIAAGATQTQLKRWASEQQNSVADQVVQNVLVNVENYGMYLAD